MEELGAADMAMAVSLSVHILSQYPVVTWGTDEQHARWLPAMLAGEALGAFALTEPHAGIRRRGDPDAGRAGRRDGDAYRLTGTKIWISNAPGGRALPRLRDGRSGGWVEGHHGVPRREGHARLPVRGARAEDGDPGLPGGGARVRGLRGAGREPARRGGRRLPDRAVGARRGPDLDRGGVRRAGAGRAGGRGRAISASGRRSAAPLSEQQGLRFMLAEMARDVAAARALTREAARGQGSRRAAGRGVVARQVDRLGRRRCGSRPMPSSCSAASGYSRETGIERLMRDAKGAQIYEGTNQIHRLIVADEVLQAGRRRVSRRRLILAVSRGSARARSRCPRDRGPRRSGPGPGRR